MTVEAVLASLHLLAVLTLVVFLSSQTALCRSEWLNAAVIERLANLDRIYAAAAVLVLASGLGRVFWGVKGVGWYMTQPWFYWKVGLFVVIAMIAIAPSLAFRRWQRHLHETGTLPAAAEIAKVRRSIMVQSHIVPIVAVIAVFWTRGW